MSHTIELRKVSKFYSNKDTVSTGFSRVDLKLDMGEFVVITGESGSGKSTLLNVISGLDTYEEGEMFVCGEDTSGYRTEDYERYRKTFIGNIFQDFNLVNSYTVYQNIELGMLLSGKKRSECRARIKELINMVGLSEYTKTKASKLSGGQKQRVAIARALAKDAPIIVADEPTGNLDSESATRVMEILNRISADKLVVIVTHNYEQAEPYVTRKLTMHDGKIIEDKRLRGDRTSGAESEAPAGANMAQRIPDESVRTDKTSEYDLYNALYGLAERSPESMLGAESDPGNQEAIKIGGRAARNRDAEQKPQSRTHRQTAPVNHGNRNPRMNARTQRQSMSLGTQFRLGIRNTFNIPAKFLLLLVVYMFVLLAVLSQYSSTKENLYQQGTLGYNNYFTDQSLQRVVIKKQDKSAFTDEDIAKIEAMDNINYVVENDLGLDTSAMLDSQEFDVSGPVYPVKTLTDVDFELGGMPTADNEIVIKVSPESWAYDEIMNMGDTIIGSEYYLVSGGELVEYGERLTSGKVRIAGVMVDDEESDTNISDMGYSTIYVSDQVSSDILLTTVAATSSSEIYYSGTKAETDSGQSIFMTDGLNEGQTYIFQTTAEEYYEEGKAAGKKINVRVENLYFDSELNNLNINKVLTEKDAENLLGIDKEEYEFYTSRLYVGKADFEKLYRRGNFQISAFMDDETLAQQTCSALNKAGFTTLAIKDTLSDATEGYEGLVKLIQYIRLIVMFIVLFFIAYAIIRLIMRSRNSYYSTLRILGASKGNTDRILRVELVLVMAIACGLVAGMIYLIKSEVIDPAYTTYISERINFLANSDYIWLFGATLLMSLLIAGRYSRKIFSSSAMNVYREEA